MIFIPFVTTSAVRDISKNAASGTIRGAAQDGMDMKEEIERRLYPLVGEPLSDMFRFAGIQVLEFGVQRPCKNRKVEDVTRADQSLHVSCHWRIAGPDGTVVTSDDFGQGGSRCDEKAYPFYDMLGEAPPAVEAIEADELGNVVMRLANGYMLEIRLDTETEASGSDMDLTDDEQWRYLPRDEGEDHFVITSRGIER